MTFKLFVIVLSAFLGASRAYALEGVGALVTQVSGGVSVNISGRHAPRAQIVMIDESSSIVAAALDRGAGQFSFSFDYNQAQNGNLRLFAIDLAGETRPLVVGSGGLVNELLPPTLVFNPDVPVGNDIVGVGGYSASGATITLELESEDGLFRTDVVSAAQDGGWEFVYGDLPRGRYFLVASSSVEQLSSQDSVVLEFIVDDELPLQAENIGDTVANVVTNVGRVLPPVVTDVARRVAPEAEQVTQVVAPVASAGLLAQLALLLRDILYWGLQALISGMQYFGFWRKRHPWGVVYDSITKQPVMLATVRLYSAGKIQKLIETDVTSKLGIFSFFPNPGDYLLKVQKVGYQFPSALIRGGSDGEYAHVYHGESIHFESQSAPVEVSVPVDPGEVKADLKFKVVNFIRTRIYVFTIASLGVGLLMTILAILGGQNSAANGVLVAFYSGVLLFQGYLAYRRHKAWGKVVDKQDRPIESVRLDLVDPVFERLVQRRVTDKDGKYQFVVPEGSYVIRIASVEHTLIKTSKKTYQGQEIVVSGNKPKLIALKLRVAVV